MPGLAERGPMLILDSGELTQRPVRQHERPSELGHELLHRLAHPEHRVAPERHAASGLIALERAEQPNDTLLNQLHPVYLRRVAVDPCRGCDQRNEGLDEPRPGGRVAAPGGSNELPLAVRRELAPALQVGEVAHRGRSRVRLGSLQSRGQLAVRLPRPGGRGDQPLAFRTGQRREFRGVRRAT